MPHYKFKEVVDNKEFICAHILVFNKHAMTGRWSKPDAHVLCFNSLLRLYSLRHIFHKCSGNVYIFIGIKVVHNAGSYFAI